MNQAGFEKLLYDLTRKQMKVLRYFLEGKEDLEIAQLMNANDKSGVRLHISNICRRFGFANESGEHYSYRDELIALFVQFKPEWVCLGYRERYTRQAQKPSLRPDRPGSPLSIKSPFYIQRDRHEPYLDEIAEPGALLRIRAPQKMGKTSLLYRLLANLREQSYCVVRFNFRRDVDRQTLQDLSHLLQWFCRTVRDALDLDPLAWNGDLPTRKDEASRYFQNYVLKQLQIPLVLILDEADWLFEHPVTAKDFFTLLRGWHENAKSPGMEIWEQLRLVIAHSTDDYMKFDSSPFGNVGRVIRLAQLNQQQIEQLIKQYELPKLGSTEIVSLMSMVGGHPYLIQQALYCLKSQEQSLTDLLRLAPTLQGIYKSHLEELSNKLNTQPILYDAFKQVLHVENKAKLSQEQTFKLEGMGLVQLQGNQVHLSCELYDRFFRAWF